MRVDALLKTSTGADSAPLTLLPAAGRDVAGTREPLRDLPVVRLEGISRYWGRGEQRWAVLRDVDLDVAPATAVCISGRNGAGKTTLLRIATGLLQPDAGTVSIDGIASNERWGDYHRRIGFLSAGDRGLYARVSVRGHLRFWSAVAFVPRRERKRLIDDALSQFGLRDLADRRAERLSQGQRQRLRLALTVVHQPQVLFLDEPMNSLDQEGLEMLTVAIRAVLSRGGSVIWCSPLGEQQSLDFDRELVIEDARLIPA